MFEKRTSDIRSAARVVGQQQGDALGVDKYSGVGGQGMTPLTSMSAGMAAVPGTQSAGGIPAHPSNPFAARPDGF